MSRSMQISESSARCFHISRKAIFENFIRKSSQYTVNCILKYSSIFISKALMYIWLKLRVCTIWRHFSQQFFVLLSQYFQQSRAMKKSHSLFYFIWKVLFWFNIHQNISYDYGLAGLMVVSKDSKEWLSRLRVAFATKSLIFWS